MPHPKTGKLWPSVAYVPRSIDDKTTFTLINLLPPLHHTQLTIPPIQTTNLHRQARRARLPQRPPRRRLPNLRQIRLRRRRSRAHYAPRPRETRLLLGEPVRPGFQPNNQIRPNPR
jgi:hypothetical protein